MLLRDVDAGDVEAYRRMRCDPVMMADLGGPVPEESVAGQLRHDLDLVARGAGLIKMIVPDPADPAVVAGTVTLHRHEIDGAPAAEIGWMVLPEHQGRGVAGRAVRMLLDEARRVGGWSPVHAFPGVDNAASNGLCRSLGFALLGGRETPFRGRIFRTRHWVLDLRA
ncbi:MULTISPECIES: GNAT family N-acetyltransferase [Micromonospora]|uniref:Protein N-acetyltransferase, RimJ/RimL family n=1 Tax=Micromonospora haikouensis TaxID=686309 RepID=A0A1C4Y8L5_9ACTN|nr:MULTISPECIES: GNAT family N-acetyltransferase [Micromonospora]MDI5937799.1 GNAT family N-acetyltransferase [Micromonospora sp. DH15]OON30131.1 GNAT family N-acetyltransferase [Micromonospora sp. Rc5]SCF17044.1 Protein N-acetyltransferase, RimJ/RimL family [Micromonospora haikouensis]